MHLGSTYLCRPGRCDDPECPLCLDALEEGTRAQRDAADQKVREDRADEARDQQRDDMALDAIDQLGWRSDE